MTRLACIAFVPFVLVLGAASARAEDDDIDVLREDIAVDARTPDLAIDVEVSARAIGTVNYLYILTHGWTDVRVTLDGAELVEDTVDLPPSYVGFVRFYQLAAPIAADSDFTFTLHYGGTPDCGSFGSYTCRVAASDVLLLASGTSPWYFDNVFLSAALGSDVWTGTIAVRAPASREVVAGQGAALAITDEDDGSRTHRFGFDVPTSALAVWLRDGAPQRVEGSVPFLGYSDGQATHVAHMQRFLATAAAAWDFYGQAFGAVDVNEVHVMTVPSGFPFGGLGFIGNIFIGDFVVGDDDYLVEQGAAHETAHTWWAGLASGVGNDGFVHESLAEYSAWRALGAARGDDTRTSGVRMNSLWYMLGRTSASDIAVLDPGLFDSPLMVYIAYHKTSTILRMIEEEVGLPTMDKVLQSFIADGPNTLSISEIVARAEKESGKDLSLFRTQWLSQTGFPTFFVTGAATPDGAGWDVGLRLEQAGTVFAVGLPVRMAFADGTTRDERVTAANAKDNFGWAAEQAPIEVAVDPRWTALRVVHAKTADVTLDGVVDAGDLMAVALRVGTKMPSVRRVDGHFDPFYDLDDSRAVDDKDLAVVVRALAP